jgi:hypothetical protein
MMLCFASTSTVVLFCFLLAAGWKECCCCYCCLSAGWKLEPTFDVLVLPFVRVSLKNLRDCLLTNTEVAPNAYYRCLYYAVSRMTDLYVFATQTSRRSATSHDSKRIWRPRSAENSFRSWQTLRVFVYR